VPNRPKFNSDSKTRPRTAGFFVREIQPELSGTTTEAEKMVLNDKQDCAEYFARIFEQTAAWRRKKAAEYPDDLRNLKAGEMLDQLAIDSAKMTDAQWEELKPYFGWSSQTFRDALIQATKLVGFAHRNRSWESFIKLTVWHLPTSRAAA
jgi:predicted aminopeptidase